ncbi:MAG: hypothetical protein C4291_12795 [Candidatus Dadabacteria bacterium]
MTKDELFHKNLILSQEFDLYVLEHPEILEEIPEHAKIVLLPEDDPELAEINLRMARKAQEPGQPIVFIRLGKLKPLTSRITRFKMEIAENY